MRSRLHFIMFRSYASREYSSSVTARIERDALDRTSQCHPLMFVPSRRSSTIQRLSPSPHFAILGTRGLRCEDDGSPRPAGDGRERRDRRDKNGTDSIQDYNGTSHPSPKPSPVKSWLYDELFDCNRLPMLPDRR